eukprot:52354-Prorocentrum_minimum.AAC.5
MHVHKFRSGHLSGELTGRLYLPIVDNSMYEFSPQYPQAGVPGASPLGVQALAGRGAAIG